MFAKGRGVDTPADAGLGFDGERGGDVGARGVLDSDRVRRAAVIKIHRRRIAEQPVAIPVQADDVFFVDRDVKPFRRGLRRAAKEFFKVSVHPKRSAFSNARFINSTLSYPRSITLFRIVFRVPFAWFRGSRSNALQ